MTNLRSNYNTAEESQIRPTQIKIRRTNNTYCCKSTNRGDESNKWWQSQKYEGQNKNKAGQTTNMLEESKIHRTYQIQRNKTKSRLEQIKLYWTHKE